MLNIDLKDFIKKHKLKLNQTLYLSFKTNGKTEISNLINKLSDLRITNKIRGLGFYVIKYIKNILNCSFVSHSKF